MKKDKILAIAMTSVITTGALAGCANSFKADENVPPCIYGSPQSMGVTYENDDSTASQSELPVTEEKTDE